MDTRENVFYSFHTKKPAYCKKVFVKRKNGQIVTGFCGDNGVYLSEIGVNPICYSEFVEWAEISV